MIPVRFMYVTEEKALLELEGRMPGIPPAEMLVCPDGVHTFQASVVSWHRNNGIEVMCEQPAGMNQSRVKNAPLVAAGWMAVGMKAPK